MEKKYLLLLIGEVVMDVNISVDQFVPLYDKTGKKDVTIIATVIQFSDYKLTIDNPHKVLKDNEVVDLKSIIGKKVIYVVEEQHFAEVSFEGNLILIVDMRDEVYQGPEAMCLYGPDNFWIVWN